MRKDNKSDRVKRFAQIWSLSRADTGKTQEYMANGLGVSKKTIQNWEKGASASASWVMVLEKTAVSSSKIAIFVEVAPGLMTNMRIKPSCLPECRRTGLWPQNSAVACSVRGHLTEKPSYYYKSSRVYLSRDDW